MVIDIDLVSYECVITLLGVPIKAIIKAVVSLEKRIKPARRLHLNRVSG